jgi:hypothetical protein
MEGQSAAPQDTHRIGLRQGTIPELGYAVSLIAHDGGWDEILMVAGPLVVFAGVLFLANRRANTKLAQANVEAVETDPVDIE